MIVKVHCCNIRFFSAAKFLLKRYTSTASTENYNISFTRENVLLFTRIRTRDLLTHMTTGNTAKSLNIQ